ncbi:MAG: 3-deoxy-manno-octulosonate cytidylyltransferase [Pseudomonadota bacterium]
MTFRIVIPARHASVRLPGKALLDIAGEPLVVRVMRRAQRAGARQVLVATDHAEIAKAVRAAGGDVQMTDVAHQSGTDRIAEVARARAWPEDEVVVNVQGDEPLIPPAVIGQCAALLAEDAGADLATLAWPIETTDELASDDVVKVVCDQKGDAMYFSRASIPFDREGVPAPGTPLALRHIGLYAYRVRSLLRLAGVPAPVLEQRERLEQLRALWLGMRIRVALAEELPPRGVDTAQDLALVRESFLT